MKSTRSKSHSENYLYLGRSCKPFLLPGSARVNAKQNVCFKIFLHLMFMYYYDVYVYLFDVYVTDGCQIRWISPQDTKTLE